LKLLSGRRSSDFAAKLLKALLHRHFSDFGHYFPTGLLTLARPFISRMRVATLFYISIYSGSIPIQRFI
jgi:hypothetical protein